MLFSSSVLSIFRIITLLIIKYISIVICISITILISSVICTTRITKTARTICTSWAVHSSTSRKNIFRNPIFSYIRISISCSILRVTISPICISIISIITIISVIIYSSIVFLSVPCLFIIFFTAEHNTTSSYFLF